MPHRWSHFKNYETTNAPLVSDSEDNEESATVAGSSTTQLPVAIPELTHQSSNGTSSGTQSTDTPILIEDENGETANVGLYLVIQKAMKNLLLKQIVVVPHYL